MPTTSHFAETLRRWAKLIDYLGVHCNEFKIEHVYPDEYYMKFTHCQIHLTSYRHSITQPMEYTITIKDFNGKVLDSLASKQLKQVYHLIKERCESEKKRVNDFPEIVKTVMSILEK